jgi:regulator of sigma D
LVKVLKLKKELLETKLSQLEDYNSDGHIKIIDELLKIHANWSSKAKKLVEKNNIKSIEDLHASNY